MIGPRRLAASAKGVWFGVLLALLVGAAVFGGCPLAAPAADADPAVDQGLSTPIIAEPTEFSTEIATVQPTAVSTLEPTATPDEPCADPDDGGAEPVDPEPTSIATPIAIDDLDEAGCPAPE